MESALYWLRKDRQGCASKNAACNASVHPWWWNVLFMKWHHEDNHVYHSWAHFWIIIFNDDFHISLLNQHLMAWKCNGLWFESPQRRGGWPITEYYILSLSYLWSIARGEAVCKNSLWVSVTWHCMVIPIRMFASSPSCPTLDFSLPKIYLSMFYWLQISCFLHFQPLGKVLGQNLSSSTLKTVHVNKGAHWGHGNVQGVLVACSLLWGVMGCEASSAEDSAVALHLWNKQTDTEGKSNQLHGFRCWICDEWWWVGSQGWHGNALLWTWI